MGKVNNALRMLAILRSRKKVSRKELAQELEVSVREITRYKDDLEYAGVNIKNILGKFGGYELEGNDYLLNLDLSKNEFRALDSIEELLKVSGSHFYLDMKNINYKIKAVSKTQEEYERKSFYSKGITIRSNYEEEKKKWSIINDSILNNRKIEIVYINAKGENSKRIIRPYSLFTYYGANFFVGFCENRNEIRQFKLVRINEIKLLDDKFQKDEFDIKEYLDNKIGVFGEEEYKIKLKILYPYAQGFKEFSWLINEEIEDFKEDNYILYKATAKGKMELINWIIGMGSNCIVLEPEILRNDINKELNKMLDFYKT